MIDHPKIRQVAPPLEEIISLASILGASGVADMPAHEVTRHVNRLLQGHPLVASTNPRPPNRLWRGRRSSDGGFPNLQDIVQPPPDRCTSYQRCSGPRQPILYTSTSLETVFAEIGAAAGDHVQVIQVVPSETCTLKVARIGEIDHYRRFGRTIIGSAQVEGFMRELFPTDEMTDHQVQMAFVDAFLADIFSRPGQCPGAYLVSSIVSTIYIAAGMDGIAYPSVAHRGGMNVALHPRSAPQLYVGDFAVYRIERSLGYGLHQRRLIRRASEWDQAGRVAWTNIDDSEHSRPPVHSQDQAASDSIQSPGQ